MAHTVKRVAVVATGTIGASWAAYFLARGLDVEATDPSPGAEQRLRDAVAAHWVALAQQGLAPGASPQRLRFHARLEDALAQADFVQENGPERLDFKLDLFRRMDAATPAHVVLASSSSGLAVTDMQKDCAHPGRVVLGHPFNPPHMIPLVEVGGGDQGLRDEDGELLARLDGRPAHRGEQLRGLGDPALRLPILAVQRAEGGEHGGGVIPAGQISSGLGELGRPARQLERVPELPRHECSLGVAQELDVRRGRGRHQCGGAHRIPLLRSGGRVWLKCSHRCGAETSCGSPPRADTRTTHSSVKVTP